MPWSITGLFTNKMTTFTWTELKMCVYFSFYMYTGISFHEICVKCCTIKLWKKQTNSMMNVETSEHYRLNITYVIIDSLVQLKYLPMYRSVMIWSILLSIWSDLHLLIAIEATCIVSYNLHWRFVTDSFFRWEDAKRAYLKFIKVLEKCTKNLIGHSRLAFNNHESNIDC